MTRTSWPARVALAMVVAGLAGCANARPAGPTAAGMPAPTPSGAAAPAPSAPPTSTVIDLATRSGTWPGTQNLLETAINKLNRQCMTAQGFPVAEAPSPAYPVPEDEAAAVNLPARMKNGYAMEGGGAAEQGPQTDTFYEKLSPAEKQRYTNALLGPPDKRTPVDLGGGRQVTVRSEGCEASSRRALAGDAAVWARLTYLPQAIDDRLAKQAVTTPGYTAALEAWRSCMTARGYPYKTPQLARDSVEAAYRMPNARAKLRAQEVSTAVADGECALEAHLVAAELAARRSLVTTLPPEDLRVLAELAMRREEALARARTVVGQ